MVLPADGSPLSYKEVTVAVEGWRLLLFIADDLEDQSEKRNDEGTKLKQLGPCNHAAHPLSCGSGAKKITPEKRGNRLPLLVAPM